MAKKKWAVSESHLDKLWRAAVKSKGFCAKCGCTYGLQAHHIVKRRFKVLRWDVKNGIPLCPACHEWVHNTPRGKQWEIEYADIDYLEKTNCNLKDYLIEYGITNNEFRVQMKDRLKQC
jgi:hypothetical protein